MIDNGGCSGRAWADDEDPVGTAPHAVSWVGVVSGTGDSPVVPEALLAALGSTAGIRVVRLTGPAAVAGSGAGEPPALVLAGTRPGRTWRRDVPAERLPEAVAALGRDGVAGRLGDGQDPGVGRRSDRSAVLVCADGRRDACCGRLGPPTAVAVARCVAGIAGAGSDVFTCTDIGGHRFAPTAVVLPWGLAFGGLGPDPEALASAVAGVLTGKPLVHGYRGRSTYPPAVQVAEAAARRHLALVATNAGADDVLVDGTDELPVPAELLVPVGAGGSPGDRSDAGDAGDTGDTGDTRDAGDTGDAGAAGAAVSRHAVRLRHTGGRTIRVRVTRIRTGVRRPLGCDGGAGPVDVWEADVDADPPTQLWWGGLTQ